MRGVTNITTVLEEEGVMEDLPVQLTAGDLVPIMVVLAALCMIGTMDQHMKGAGALIMVGPEVLNLVGTGVLNMADTAGIVFHSHSSIVIFFPLMLLKYS